MTDFFSGLRSKLSGEEFEETPVKLEEFLYSDYFLGLKEVSDHQLELISAMTQVYKWSTIEYLWGAEYAEFRFKQTCNEVIACLGKGAGKDFSSTIAVAYIVYQLMCLRDPAVYYGLASGENIDIINIAINADQANRVFFKAFMERIRHCPWFEGKYDDKTGEVNFDKNINVYSGHSEREAYEGYNTLVVVLDEIDGFAMTSTSGNLKSKTAPEIYQMYRASVTSRFPDWGKLVLLSFPRSDTGMILTRYNAVIAEKETIQRSETVKIDPDGPDTDDNKLTVEWDEDHITRYIRPKVFAMRRPSWEVRPGRTIQNYIIDFLENYGDSLARYCCMPNSLSDGFFKRHESIDNAFIGMNGVDQDGEFHPSFRPKEGIKYYIHVDLAQKHDRAVVALAHVDRWIRFPTASGNEETLPHVTVDALRWWTPTKDNEIDFQWIIDYIVSVVGRGFDVELVTFDRWNSNDVMKNLERRGIKTGNLSLKLQHYVDLKSVMYGGRLTGPDEELVRSELKDLVENKGKVDHKRSKHNDLSEGVCGAVYNAITHTNPNDDREVDVWTYADLKKHIGAKASNTRQEELKRQNIIQAPPVNMPADIAQFLKLI